MMAFDEEGFLLGEPLELEEPLVVAQVQEGLQLRTAALTTGGKIAATTTVSAKKAKPPVTDKPAKAQTPQPSKGAASPATVTPKKSVKKSAKKSAKTAPVFITAIPGQLFTMVELLGEGESRGAGYNAYRGKDQRQALTEMTLGELRKRQMLPASNPLHIGAAGKYQMIPMTLDEGSNLLALDLNSKFTPALQDRLFSEYLLGRKHRKIEDYIKIAGKIPNADPSTAMSASVREWRAIADPKTGETFADKHKGANTATIKASSWLDALQLAAKLYQVYLSQGKDEAEAYRLAVTATSATPEVEKIMGPFKGADSSGQDKADKKPDATAIPPLPATPKPDSGKQTGEESAAEPVSSTNPSMSPALITNEAGQTGQEAAEALALNTVPTVMPLPANGAGQTGQEAAGALVLNAVPTVMPLSAVSEEAKREPEIGSRITPKTDTKAVRQNTRRGGGQAVGGHQETPDNGLTSGAVQADGGRYAYTETVVTGRKPHLPATPLPKAVPVPERNNRAVIPTEPLRRQAALAADANLEDLPDSGAAGQDGSGGVSADAAGGLGQAADARPSAVNNALPITPESLAIVSSLTERTVAATVQAAQVSKKLRLLAKKTQQAGKKLSANRLIDGLGRVSLTAVDEVALRLDGQVGIGGSVRPLAYAAHPAPTQLLGLPPVPSIEPVPPAPAAAPEPRQSLASNPPPAARTTVVLPDTGAGQDLPNAAIAHIVSGGIRARPAVNAYI